MTFEGRGARPIELPLRVSVKGWGRDPQRTTMGAREQWEHEIVPAILKTFGTLGNPVRGKDVAVEKDEITREEVVELMRGERFTMLSTVDVDKKIVAHPMTPQRITDDAVVWFFIAKDSDTAEMIRRNRQVNLAFADSSTWLSVSGTAEFVDNPDLAAELWDDQLKEYFPAGLDDPQLGLVKVDGDSAQYWGIRGGAAVASVKIMASKITGSEPPGSTATTRL